MAGFDIIVIGVFIISIFIGIMRGLIKESLSITGWVVSSWLARNYATEAGQFFSQFMNIPNPTFRIWVGFALVFVISLFVFALINFIITKLLVRGPIKGTDRFLGIFFGALRAWLIILAILVLVKGLGFSDTEWWSKSKFVPFFEPSVIFVESTLFKEDPNQEETENKSLQDQVIDKAVENLKEQAYSTGDDQKGEKKE